MDITMYKPSDVRLLLAAAKLYSCLNMDQIKSYITEQPIIYILKALHVFNNLRKKNT